MGVHGLERGARSVGAAPAADQLARLVHVAASAEEKDHGAFFAGADGYLDTQRGTRIERCAQPP